MDPLSDVLRAVRLNGAYFYMVEGARPWSVATLPALQLAPRILPDADHLVPYHILAEGVCWGGLHGEPRVRMEAGDVLLFPQGDAHIMSSQATDQGAPSPIVDTPDLFPSTVRLGSGQREVVLMCGFLGFDSGPFNPLIDSLPRVLHMPRIGNGWLATLPDKVLRESREPTAGSASVLTRLAEVMFIEVLRQHIGMMGSDQRGWLAALRDPVVGAALARLHERPSHDWSLPELAREVAVSRSVLAERFTDVVGMPPIQYLTQWRLQLAADLLARGTAKVSAVGAQVGYDSEAAFSRAFKRATGTSPAEWRRRRQATHQ